MSKRRARSSTSDEDLDAAISQAAEIEVFDLLDDEDGHDVLLGSRLEEELNCSIEKMREEEKAVPIARLIRLEGSLGSSSQGSSNNSPNPVIMESTTSQMNGTLELLEDVEMPSLSLCESAELVSLVSISPSSPVKGFSFRVDGQVNGTFVADSKRENVYSVSYAQYRKQPPTEEFDIADKIDMLSALPTTTAVNKLINFDEKETEEKDVRRMTLDCTKSFSGAFLAEACGIVDELDGLAANMTSSPIVSPERRISPDRRMTLGPDLDLLDMENMNDSLLSSLAGVNSPAKMLPASLTPLQSPVAAAKKGGLHVASVKKVDSTYDRLARLLNETQDVIAASAVTVEPAISNFVQSNKVLNTTFDGEATHLVPKIDKPSLANTTFDQKQLAVPSIAAIEKIEHLHCANTTFEMKDDNPVNTTFDQKENLAANTTFDFISVPEAKTDLNVTFEKGEYRIHALNETVNLMDAEADVLKLILDATPKKCAKAIPDAASTPKAPSKPPQSNSKGTVTKDPAQSFLHRMSLNVRNEQVKSSAIEGQQSVAESSGQAVGHRSTVPGFRMGYLDQQAMSNQLRRLHNGPTLARGVSGPMRALPLHAMPMQANGKQVESVHMSDDTEGITPLDCIAEPAAKEIKPCFGSVSSIENERPGTPDIGIDVRSSTPDLFRPGDPGSGPRITSTPAMRGGVFARMVGMDGPAPTPIAAPVSRLQRVISIASTGSLPESLSEDPLWPGISQDSTKDSKGLPGTPANHGSVRSLQALRLTHQSVDKPHIEANDIDLQDKKSNPIAHNPDIAIAPSNDDVEQMAKANSLPTPKLEDHVTRTDNLSDDRQAQADINEENLPEVIEKQQLIDEHLIVGKIEKTCTVTENIKTNSLEVLNKTIDMPLVAEVNEDKLQMPAAEPQLIVGSKQAETGFTQALTSPSVSCGSDCSKPLEIVLTSESVPVCQGLNDIEECMSGKQNISENIQEKEKSHIISQQEMKSSADCLTTTTESVNTDLSNINSVVVEKQDSLPNKSQEATVPKQKRNISTESNESSISVKSSELNDSKQTKVKRTSQVYVRRSTARSTVDGKKKLNTSKNSTGNSSFVKAEQQRSAKKTAMKAAVESGKPLPDQKKQQSITKPTLGARKSLPLSSPSQGYNRSFTKSNKENFANKSDGNSKQSEGNVMQPQPQIKTRQSLLPAGKNPTQRAVLGPSNIQIRKANVQTEKKTGLPIKPSSGAPRSSNLKKSESNVLKLTKPKSMQPNRAGPQDFKSINKQQSSLKPPNKRMKAALPVKSPQKVHSPKAIPQQVQGGSKIATGSHLSGIASKLARPQMASGLQLPATAKIATANSTNSKLPGLRPPSDTKAGVGKKVSGIMPPGIVKPSVLRAPRPVAR